MKRGQTGIKRGSLSREAMDERLREQKAAYTRKYQRQYRDLIHQLLGHKCVRCGFSDDRALQIDHVYGGGTKETRSMSVGAYRKKVIASVALGEGLYQLLCANCNWIKRAEKNEQANKKWA